MQHGVKLKRPEKIVTHLRVAVDTQDQGVKLINYKDSSDRKWLASHIFWAMHNGKEVSLIPTSN